MFDQIERLKREFTDKFVVVDAARPELARFRGQTGQVKTVNMSGRALVQFDADNNIGWYDIGLDFLKVVPKPEPKPEEEKKAKPKSEKPQTSADSPAVAPKPVAGGEKAAPAAAAGKKPSVAEMLRAQAAAKSGGAATAPAGKEAPKEPAAKAPAKAPEVRVEDPGIAATGEIPAQEKATEKAPEKKPEEAKPAGEKKKLSTAEILASLKKKP